MRKITHYLCGKINKSEPQSRNNNNTVQRSFRVRQSGSQNLKYFAMKNCTNIIEKMLLTPPLMLPCPPYLFISAAAQVKCQICIKKQQQQQRQQKKLVVYIVFQQVVKGVQRGQWGWSQGRWVNCIITTITSCKK